MAANTISDLPRDALVLILRAVYQGARCQDYYAHFNLRRVSREWRDVADIAFIEHEQYCVRLDRDRVRDPALRARYPSMMRALDIVRCSNRSHDGRRHNQLNRRDWCGAPNTALALSSLFASPELRRVLKRAKIAFTCCVDEAAAAVSAVVACPHLTSLEVDLQHGEHDGDVQFDMLAPLGQLTGLKRLSVQAPEGEFPTLPDVPSLTSLALVGESPNGTFVPVASDATLGRLRRLTLENNVKLEPNIQWSSNDPFELRADLEAGAWRPHLLTRVRKLNIKMLGEISDGYFDEAEIGVYDGTVPAAAVWAPLAATVTKLELTSMFAIYRAADLETGMCAGLGVLTGLQSLVVYSTEVLRSPVVFGRVHLPHLTNLSFRGHRGRPIDVARFPRLVHVDVAAEEAEPLVLSSVAALGRLASLRMAGWYDGVPHLNLAQLFDGGRRLAALTRLSFRGVTLVWHAAAAPGAPPAAEFAARARALLPSLRSVKIRQIVDMEEGVQDFVVPALRALGRG